jgi:8-oxo-dGTP diphosphatase
MEYTYKYPRPAVTADCIVFTKDKTPKVLLIKRKNEPYKGCWAFPGGFLNMDETLMQCAYRELQEETGIGAGILDIKEIGSYSKVDRDPRGRTITVAFLVLVEHETEVKGQDDAAEAKWFPITEIPSLAFDHEDIMLDAEDAYREMIEECPIEFHSKTDDKIDHLVDAMAKALMREEKKFDEFSMFDMAIAVAELYSHLAMFSVEQTGMAVDDVIRIFLNSLMVTFEKASTKKIVESNDKIILQIQESMQKALQKLSENEQKLAEIRSKDPRHKGKLN